MRSHRAGAWGAALCVLGLSAFLVGCGGCGRGTTGVDANPAPPASASVAPPSGFEEVHVRVDAKGFKPDQVRWTRGSPLAVVFQRNGDDACGDEVAFPELNVSRPLPLRTPVSVSVPTAGPGIYAFRCGTSPFVGHVMIR